ncbi:hypothetical protein O4G98_16935 [Zoogloeaceae bacterium G21618-S1]|nr:hypothetical protein [Zoogloeaceae bacterium G21618-S1]
MLKSDRVRAAVAASSKHLLGSAVVALICSALVFLLWYPYPYSELVGGKELFLIVLAVDLVCGPLLTLIVFDPEKPRSELFRDIGMVIAMQFAALGYGLYSVAEARPVFLGFEGNRFRVVTLPEIDISAMGEAEPGFRDFSLLGGPRLIGVRVAQGTDPDFRESVQLSLQGLHSSFRPSRWVEFDSQREQVLGEMKPVENLRKRYPAEVLQIDEAVQASGLDDGKIGFLPLVAKTNSSWVVLVSAVDARPVGFLPLDGW